VERDGPECDLIMCTGFIEMIDEKKTKAVGIKKYVMKPVTRIEILKAIRKVLD